MTNDTRHARVSATVTYVVADMPDFDAEADKYADASTERIRYLLEGMPGVLEGSVRVEEWDEVPEEGE